MLVTVVLAFVVSTPTGVLFSFRVCIFGGIALSVVDGSIISVERLFSGIVDYKKNLSVIKIKESSIMITNPPVLSLSLSFSSEEIWKISLITE